MNDDADPRIDELDQLVQSEHRGVRVFWMTGETMQDLVNRLAFVLGEHMTDSDELHVTYNAMQNGWQNHPPTRSLVRGAQPGTTELFFEYSAFVVLRRRASNIPPLQ